MMHKKIFYGLLAAAATLLTFSCSREESLPETLPTAALHIGIHHDGSGTKAVDTALWGNEGTVTSAQLLVFKADGTLERYLDLGTALNAQLDLTVGPKRVWALLNGPDAAAILTENDLLALDIPLGDYNAPGRSFVMAGSGSCLVAAGQRNECTVSASRFVSRISLVKVVNRLSPAYGELVLESVSLSNVVGNQKLSGDAPHTLWYNRMGRQDETPAVASHIIDGSSYTASCPDVTYASLAGSRIALNGETASVSRLYCYPNGTQGDVSGFSAAFTPRFTRMVVCARILGVKYYYPIAIPKPERNKAYEITLTVVAPGAVDPDMPVEKGSFFTLIDLSEWGAGINIDEEI